MKKSVIIAVLGVAASVATSYGQGYVVFSSYAQTAASSPITQLQGGALVGSPYVAQLYFALGTVSDTPGTGLPSGAFTLAVGNVAGNAYPSPISGGFFDGPAFVIPGYTGGAITFEVVAYDNASYGASDIRGKSGGFTMTSIRTDGVYSNFGDNGQPMPAFTVAAVPEPTTLALAGLGGLASLVALRRKQA